MLLPGDTIADRYEVVRELGRGGMGVVYEAVRRDIGLTVALKVLHDPAPKRASRFAHEARITASLRSDHIVRVLDFGTVDDAYPFLVMEMLEGFSLEDELHRGALSAEAAVDWLMEAAAGLAEAHEKRIVHRDLKPSNLFLARGADGGQRLKLLDFGVARALLPEQLRATEASAVMGTPPYMSPEQLRDSRQADARSDIWSLGVILYELVSGGLPFPGDTSTAVVAAIAADEPSPLPDTVAPELKSVIARCLNKDASRRFQTVAALASALEKLGGERSARAMASIRSLAEYGARGSSNQPEPTSDATQTENSTRSPDPRTHSTLGALSQTLSGSSRRWPALAPLVALAAVLGVAVVGWFWVGFGATTATSVAPATKPAETSAASAGYETTRIHLAGVSAAHRVLDSHGEYQRLGATRRERSDFRLICATNRIPESLKHDLLGRLTLRVETPALAERREDIPFLLLHLLERAGRSTLEVRERYFDDWDGQRGTPRIDVELVEGLLMHRYRQNVRELDTLLWLSILNSPSSELTLVDEVRARMVQSVSAVPLTAAMIRQALARHGGNQSKTWQELGMPSRYALIRAMKRFGISGKDDDPPP